MIETSHVFQNAIVRLPGINFAQGLTTVHLGVPLYDKVLQQHARYCEALRECGLTLTALDADLDHPDSTFVEDTAVLTAHSAVLTRPGARTREGEVAAMRPTLRRFFPAMVEIEAPGTLDGGDICEADDRFFLGLSHRTNEEGARQLAAHLKREGYSSDVIDVRGMSSILHLKSGISYVGDHTLVVMEEMAGHELFKGYELIRVTEQESYAANCVRVNERVLVAAGYPLLMAELSARGFHPLELDMSEFRKMDGGLSCLSLRF
jgi:dimethylargininase